MSDFVDAPYQRINLPDTWWLGYLAGVINGISMRQDVPEDIRKNCERIVIDYAEFSNKRFSV